MVLFPVSVLSRTHFHAYSDSPTPPINSGVRMIDACGHICSTITIYSQPFECVLHVVSLCQALASPHTAHSPRSRPRRNDLSWSRSLQGAYGQKRLGSKLKTRSQPQDAMASLHAILNPGIASCLDAGLAGDGSNHSPAAGLSVIASEQFGALNLGGFAEDGGLGDASQGPGVGEKLSSPLLQPVMRRRTSLQVEGGVVLGKSGRIESLIESSIEGDIPVMNASVGESDEQPSGGSPLGTTEVRTSKLGESSLVI